MLFYIFNNFPQLSIIAFNDFELELLKLDKDS